MHWLRPSWAPPPFGDVSQERAFQRYYTHKRLPWDLIHSTLWLLSAVLHLQTFIESLCLGCRVGQHGPGWFQGVTLSSFISMHGSSAPEQSRPEDAAASCASSLQQQCSNSSCSTYPCDATVPWRLAHMVQHWEDVSTATHNIPQKLWQAHVIYYTAFPALHLIMCLLHTAIVLYLRRACRPAASCTPATSQLHQSTSGGSTAQPSQPSQQGQSKPPRAPSASSRRNASGITAAEAAALQRDIACIPAWMPAVRAWGTSLLTLAFGALLPIGQLVYPPPAELLPLTLSYAVSSVAGSQYAISMAIFSTMRMVSGSPMDLLASSLCMLSGVMASWRM
jgi:hypothetical protein